MLRPNSNRNGENMKHLPTIIAFTSIIITTTVGRTQGDSLSTAAVNTPEIKFSATVDMQIEKKLYDEYGSSFNTTRFTHPSLFGYRQTFDDMWMRVALKGALRMKNLESVFNIRFYPYWTLRRRVYVDPNSGTPPPDIQGCLDVIELNQAYLKVFKNYSPESGLNFRPHFKVGRDGLQNSCSQLFGNYLEQPAGGYGDSRVENVVGPFKNRKIFANQLEAGFVFNAYDIIGGTTSLMIGANLNNEKFYQSSTTQYWQLLDSKLTAGFFRIYQEFTVLDNLIHLGGGFKKYSAPIDSSGVLVANNYYAGQWLIEINILEGLKFYTEMAVQKMSSQASTGVVRPINTGITIPTFGVVDTLAVEFENVAKTFFSDESMRDAVAGRQNTKALGWGIVVEKRYFDRIIIDWGLYTGNPTGDMKTTLRLTSNF